MSTHNICFRREITKILCGYPLLSVAMRIYPKYSHPCSLPYTPLQRVHVTACECVCVCEIAG